MKSVLWVCALLVCGAQAGAGLAPAIHPFVSITQNGPFADAAARQISMEISAGQILSGGRQIDVAVFLFRNTGPIESSVSTIYFDGSVLGNLAAVDNSCPAGQVSFAGGKVSPSNLPGGNAIDFSAVERLSAAASNPKPKWGLNPGEWVALSYTLADGVAFADVLSALNDHTLRVGMHVQAIGGIYSESFVSAPEPMTLIILALGGIMCGFKRQGGL